MTTTKLWLQIKHLIIFNLVVIRFRCHFTCKWIKSNKSVNFNWFLKCELVSKALCFELTERRVYATEKIIHFQIYWLLFTVKVYWLRHFKSIIFICLMRTFFVNSILKFYSIILFNLLPFQLFPDLMSLEHKDFVNQVKNYQL